MIRSSRSTRHNRVNRPASTAARVVIVTQVRLFREGLARLLSEQASRIAVDMATPGESLLSTITEFKPDVVLVDAATLRDKRMVRCLQGAGPHVRLVAFTVDEEEEEVVACAEAGVAGLVTRDASVDELIAAVDSALQGELHCSPRVAGFICARLAAITHAGPSVGLAFTARQREILTLIDHGLTNK
jgi:two-component system, NarL family, nitrate/nitrite response regulator NarL